MNENNEEDEIQFDLEQRGSSHDEAILALAMKQNVTAFEATNIFDFFKYKSQCKYLYRCVPKLNYLISSPIDADNRRSIIFNFYLLYFKIFYWLELFSKCYK